MDDKLLNWEDGTLGAFNRCSIPRICAAPSTWGRHSIEAPGWGRAQAPSMNRALVDPGQAARQRFMRMSNTDKLGVAIRQFALRLPAEARAHAMALVDPGNLAIMAGALAIWVGAQATPVGWVVNIAMFGMGVVAIGAEAVDVARELRDFAVGVLGADDESELRAAVDHLAKATAIVGVDVVVALLLKKATVKVREPKMPVPEGGDSKLLFGKYDPKSAQKRLPPEKPAPKTSNQKEVAVLSPAASRRLTAEAFYREAGFSEKKIADHMRGIDFEKPVEVIKLPKGTEVIQYQVPGAPMGTYFTLPNTPGNQLGFYTSGRVPKTYVATEEIKVLRSTASSTVDDWSMADFGWKIEAPGGGTQFFTTSTGWMPK